MSCEVDLRKCCLPQQKKIYIAKKTKKVWTNYAQGHEKLTNENQSQIQSQSSKHSTHMTHEQKVPQGW